MNQPTEDRIKRLEERMDRIEQATEPINLRIERGLPAPEATLLQTIMDMVGKQGPDIGALKTDVEGIKADVLAMRESQADFRDRLENTATKDGVAAIKATQDDQGKKLDQILKLLQSRD